MSDPRNPGESSKDDLPPDIEVINSNTQGDDLVIGDVHGNRDCLKAVLDSLKTNDRLFLVGDLTDRGRDSLGVIQLLKDEKYKDKVFAVRGNHEELCLAGIAALEKMCVNGKFEKLSGDYNQYVSDKSKAEFAGKYRYKDPTEAAMLNMALNGGGWLIPLFREELASSKITIIDGVITYSKDSQIKLVKEYMDSLPYIIHVKGDKPFNVVHADMPINDEELLARINNKLGLTQQERWYATWAREGGAEAALRDTGRISSSIPTYVGHSVVAHGNVPPVRINTNTIDIDVESHATNASLVVNVTQGKSEYIGAGHRKAYRNAKLVEVLNTVNQHLNPDNKLIAVRKRKVGLNKRKAVNQSITIDTPKDVPKDTPNWIYENCKKGKLAAIDKNAALHLDLKFDSGNLQKDINDLGGHIAKLREQDFDRFYTDKNGKKVLVKYHTEKNDPATLDPIHRNEAEVQAMRYLRGMLLIAKHTTDTDVQKLLLKEIHDNYEQYKIRRVQQSADHTLWLSDQFASSISQHLDVKMDAARKQLTMARDLGILLESHPSVCTVSESKDQVTIETSTPYKVSKEYYGNPELFADIPNQHWFMNAKKLAGFGIKAEGTWMQSFFASTDFTQQVKENGVAVPPSARWLPIPANNQVVEMNVAARNEKDDMSKMEFSRTRVTRTGVAIPYDVRKLKWWKSADKEQKKIAKAKLKELMEHQLDERIKEYTELYKDLIGKNDITFYANYQTLLSPLKIVDDLGPHVDNNKKFIELVKEVMKEIDEDKVFKAKYEKMGVNLKVRHTNAAVNRNAGKKKWGIKVTTTHEYSEDEKTRREKIAEFDEIKNMIKEAVLPPTAKEFKIAEIQDLMKNAGYRDDLIKELVQREDACQRLQDLLDNKEPYKHLDRYQRNIMMAALEHLAMGSQSLTMAGCKSARDRTGVVLCAIKTMQENPDAMKNWDVLDKGIVKSLQQGHAFRSMIFHSAIVKVSLVHKRFMEQLSSNIQKDIGELLVFSRKPPEYDASKARTHSFLRNHDDKHTDVGRAHEGLFHHAFNQTFKPKTAPKNDSNSEQDEHGKLNTK